MEVVLANDLQLFNPKAQMVDLKRNSDVLRSFYVLSEVMRRPLGRVGMGGSG